MTTISYSEVDTYRRCQKRWEYRYKVRIRRKQKHVRLLKGEILHKMLDAYISHKMNKTHIGGDPWDGLEKYAEEYATYFEAEREHYGDIIGDCGQIFEGYLRKWRKDPLTYESSEVGVFFDLSDTVRFVGFIDKIATDAQGRRWLCDHKFNERIPTADDRFSELQLLIYVWAWPQVFPDKPLDGVLWDYARSKAPTKPEVLKSKELSQRKNLDCDPYTYRRAIAANHLDINNYQDILKHLEGKEDTFFERVFLPKPSQEMIAIVVDDFMQTAAEIKNKRGKKARCVRTMTPMNCNTCEFRPVCEADVRGHDSEFIIKADYSQREVQETQ